MSDPTQWVYGATIGAEPLPVISWQFEAGKLPIPITALGMIAPGVPFELAHSYGEAASRLDRLQDAAQHAEKVRARGWPAHTRSGYPFGCHECDIHQFHLTQQGHPYAPREHRIGPSITETKCATCEGVPLQDNPFVNVASV